MGRTDLGVSAIRRSLVLDPLNRDAYRQLGDRLNDAGRYREALSAYQQAQALDPDPRVAAIGTGYAYYKLGDLQSAQSWCGRRVDYYGEACLAVVYSKLGRKADAAAMLTKLKAEVGDKEAYLYAEIYAELGDRANALDWLERAFRSRDPNLVEIKADGSMATLRQEPRFQAIERELKFPD
jgi:tetratricopeptide (TPR) repeat protein